MRLAHEYFLIMLWLWKLQEGRLVRSLKGHGHWVNTLALSAEYALRTGAYDHTASAPSDPKEAQIKALQRCAQGEMFLEALMKRRVLSVSCSA